MIISGNSYESLEKHLGDRSPLMIDYTAVSIGNVMVSFPHYADLGDLDIKYYDIFDRVSAFEEIVKDLGRFTYVADQSDPSKVLMYGANCQSISILLRETLILNGFGAEYVMDGGVDHMYVRATLQGRYGDVETYDIDLVNKTLKLVTGGA